MKRKPMPEREYRASRICRVLGNPTAYQIMKILRLKTKKSPLEISLELGLTITNTSKTLRILRQVDLVRYDTEGREKKYYLKDESVLKIFSALEKFTEKIKYKKY
jgi:DNA-binding transcriptional ArsR family regulator